MAFAKAAKSERFDFGDQEVVASNFTLPDETQVSSAAKGAAITALASVTSANAGATYTSAEQTLINELKTKLNAVIAALKA